MQVEKHITLPKVGVLKVVASYDSANEVLFNYAYDNTGERFKPTQKQLDLINKKLNEDEESSDIEG